MSQRPLQFCFVRTLLSDTWWLRLASLGQRLWPVAEYWILGLLRRASCVSGSWRQVHINGGTAHQPGERDWHGAECGGVKQFGG